MPPGRYCSKASSVNFTFRTVVQIRGFVIPWITIICLLTVEVWRRQIWRKIREEKRVTSDTNWLSEAGAVVSIANVTSRILQQIDQIPIQIYFRHKLTISTFILRTSNSNSRSCSGGVLQMNLSPFSSRFFIKLKKSGPIANMFTLSGQTIYSIDRISFTICSIMKSDKLHFYLFRETKISNATKIYF